MAYDIKTQAQFFEAMKNYFLSNCDEVTDFNEGSYTRTLLESISLIAGEINLDWFIKLDDNVKSALYNSFDFDRKIGNKSNGYVTFFTQAPAPSQVTIPIGLQIDWNGYLLEITEEGIITAGETSSGEISALFINPTKNTNIGIATINTKIGKGSIVNKPDNIDWAENETAFIGGTEEETDVEMLNRFRIFVQGLTRSTVFGIESGVLSVEGVRSANIRENYPVAGWITIYAEEGDGTLSGITRAEIEKTINGDYSDKINYPGYRSAGIKIEVIAPILDIVSFTISVSMLTNSSYIEIDLINLVKTAVINYVNILKLSYDVILSEVVTSIQNIHPDIYDVSIIFPNTNIDITNGHLAKTNASLISVSINEVDY